MKDRIVGFLAALVLASAPGLLQADDPVPASGSVEPEPAAGATVDAVWVEVERGFVYFAQTTYYSCFGLREKVRYILERIGARPDLKVTSSCADAVGGVEAMPTLRIKAAFPAEATPERLAQIEKDAPRRELVARVQGRSAEQAAAPFPAAWRTVEFDGRRRGRIDDGDCELVKQLVEHVLRPAGVQVIEGTRLNCTRRHVRIGKGRLVLETLQAAPGPDATPDAPLDDAPTADP